MLYLIAFGKLLILSLIVSVSCLLIYSLLPGQYHHLFFTVVGGVLLVVAVNIMLVDFVFLLGTVRGAIYYPSSDQQIQAMLQLAQPKAGETAVDIGSGDGRIVRVMAQRGVDAHGYEINPFLIFWSQLKNWQLPPTQRGHFHLANLWSSHFGHYDVVILFGMTYIMKDLEAKLLAELPSGARVVCNSFPFPNWPATKKQGDVYLYIHP